MASVREWKEHRDLLGYTTEELRDLVNEGLASGPSAHASMADVKAEARRRLEAAVEKDTLTMPHKANEPRR
ncbi:hypothetical protein [Rhizobium jaguaris]|uniref:hypothetical protein n=1 Tax=Rhizobium jaguaris TaxID=1312183 RepID=UPI0039BFEB09